MNYYAYNGQLCNVIIAVEGTQFQAHRIVLWELSPYFRALFSRWSSPYQFMYTIPGVAPNIMKSIIQYAYSKRIRITRRNVQALLVAADYLLVSDVVRLCCQFLEKHLCPENCIEIWRFARTHSLPELCDQAFLMLEQSLPYSLGVPVPRAYFQLHSILLGVGDCSGRNRQKPYTRLDWNSN